MSAGGDRPGAMPRLRRALLTSLLLGLLALLVAMLIGGEVRAAVTRPLLYVAWFVGVLFADFPEAGLWAIFTTIGLIIAGMSLSGGGAPRRRRPDEPVESTGRVAKLARWLASASKGRYFQRQVSRHLLGLTLQSRGYYEPLSLQEVERLLEGGSLRLPPHIDDYLARHVRLAYLGDLDSMTRRRNPRLATLREFFLGSGRNGSAPVAVDPELERLVEFLESELEIGHEHRP